MAHAHAHHIPAADEAAARGFAREAAFFLGLVFIALGLLGFVPATVTDHETMGFAGPERPGLLFGLFAVSVLHNLMHLGFGLIGVVMSRATATAARLFLVGGGGLLMLFGAYGLVVADGSAANFIPTNTADDVLHLTFGAMMLLLEWVSGPPDLKD
ncbi:protein of unknown function [Actinokineospora alba]|uniref:DUF4383 domain-containing protein n=1 Tax=Actinokineospora alba TaxID=504798 RepID=A0A1H0F1V3_9PSEU|nr:DUF4383 domain-containing protein [Actinokineospora alba]TDP69308.1 uncharacterized protein DUF4383 [Actinokineospora alba]SDI19654.1 protein of unknown function [Actinokineospora alba]SDN88638.1 protein of unknown function [Actinokineospora alba]